MNLDDLFAATARRQPARPALLGPRSGDCLTYADLDAAIEAASVHLREAGVRAGQCVGLECRSGAHYIILNYAVWRCGGCVVPVPIELTAAEKEHLLRTIAIDHVITENQSAALLARLQCGRRVSIVGEIRAVPVTRLREPPPGFAAINSAFIRFTSGTTAAAKGVVLSHETIYERIQAANEVLSLGPDDRVIWLLSMAHHFAVSIVGYLTFGAAIVLLPNHFAGAILDSARRHRGTLIYGSPAHYTWLANSTGSESLANLRLAISTTAGIDRTAAQRFHDWFGVPVTQALGIIEIGLPFINIDFAASRCEAVGRVLPAYRVRLSDVGLGDNLREILLSGPGCLDAYYDPWRARSSIMPDGWFHTGDVGQVDDDGCFYLRGRLKDVINVLGMKFFPQEVEAVLTAHPAVAGASVFSRSDGRMGEVPVARVVLRDHFAQRTGERELIAHCRRQLADYKVPERIEFAEELPRTASGKILRRALA